MKKTEQSTKDRLKEAFDSNKHNEYKIKEKELASPFNRFLSFFVDIFLAIILANAFSFLVFQPILGYNKKSDEANKIKTSWVTYNEGTRLYKYDDEKNIYSDDKFFEYYVKKIASENVANQENPIYFYYRNYNEMSIETINKDIYKFNDSKLSNTYYVTDNISNEVRINDATYLTCLNITVNGYEYATATEKETYDSFKNYFMSLVKEARKDCSNRETIKDYANRYQVSIEEMTRISSNAGMISYAISTLFFFWIVPMVFGKQTFGHMIFKIKVVFQDGMKVSHFDLLSRYIMMIPLIFFGVGFASFSSYFTLSINLPFITIGDKSISYFIPCLISIIFGIICMAIINFTKEKQCYYDRALKLTVISYNPKQVGFEKGKE